MTRIFLGNITNKSDILLTKYLKKFMPDATVEPLKAAGIKGKIARQAERSEVALVILDETLYSMCEGVVKDSILTNPKVHKYIDEEGFEKFLQSKFGVLDSTPTSISEPVQDTVNPLNEDTEIPNLVDDFIVPDSIISEFPVESQQVVEEDDLDNLMVSDEEDTSSNNDKDNIIQKLNDDLIIRDTMIRNLEAQLEEKSAGTDVSHFISRINTLEEELQNAKQELSSVQNASFADLGKVTRAEQILESVTSLKEELSSEKSKCLALESSKLDLETKLKDKEEELSSLNICISKLEEKSKGYSEAKEKIAELEESISSLQSDYDLKESEVQSLIAKNEDLEQKVVDLTSQVAELGVLNEKIDSLSDENKRLQTEVSDLTSVKVDLDNLRIDYNRVSSENDSLSSRIAELQSSLDTANLSADTSLREKEKLNRDIRSLTSDNESLSIQLNEISKKLSIKDDEIESLRTQLREKEGVAVELETSRSKITELQEDISNLTMQLKQFEDTKTSLGDKISEVEELQAQLLAKKDVEKVLSEKEEELAIVKSELSSKINELNSITKERNSQSSIVAEKDIALSAKEKEVSNLTIKVKDLSSQVQALKFDKETLDTDNQKLRNEMDVLRQRVSNSEIQLESSSNLEKEVTDYKRKLARLESENTSLKEDLEKARGTTNKDVEIAKLRSEISDYKERLREVKDNNNEQSRGMSDTVRQLREKCANLEVSVLEKDDKLKQFEDNVFSKMRRIASPKTMFSLSLDMSSQMSNMYVFASGSSESNLITYQVLRRYCASTNKNILILDLVTDSYIDRELKVEKISSPIEFLQGTKPIKDFVSKAQIGNTYVCSTAFSYLNSLFLLNVDWQSILSNLATLDGIVIINVGCLTDTVSKILFNAFSSVMSSHVIIKASPVNLRTALLTLTGMPSVEKSKISCVNFENSSKGMYQRLAQRFNTQILNDSDVLVL